MDHRRVRIQRRQEQGVTLIELMISVTILAGGILTLVAVLSQSLHGGQRGLHLSTATQIAQSQLEQLQRTAWGNIPVTGAWTAPVTVNHDVRKTDGSQAQEMSYSVSWRITNVETGRVRAIDVRVDWDEPDRPNRRVVLSSIRDNFEGV